MLDDWKGATNRQRILACRDAARDRVTRKEFATSVGVTVGVVTSFLRYRGLNWTRVVDATGDEKAEKFLHNCDANETLSEVLKAKQANEELLKRMMQEHGERYKASTHPNASDSCHAKTFASAIRHSATGCGLA